MPNPTFTAFLLGLVDATSGDYKTLSADSDVWTLNRVLKMTEGDAHIVGEEAGDAILYLSADQADDNADQWRFRVQDGGTLTLETFNSAAWVAVQTWTPSGLSVPTLASKVLVKPSGDQTNIAVGSAVQVNWSSEIEDVGGDFASSIFTAPATAGYQVNLLLELAAIDSGATLYVVEIVTTARTYAFSFDPAKFSADLSNWHWTWSGMVDMSVNDTLKVQLTQTGGTQQTDIIAASYLSIFPVG